MNTFTSLKLTNSLNSLGRTTNEKTVIILATGGTIAGTGQIGKSSNYKIGDIKIETLIKAIPGIEKLANLKMIQVCNIGSCDMSAEIWLTLVKMINQYAIEPDVTGFVITHGTDTLEELSYWLNLTVKTNKPVVLTGSMRPATAISPDGAINLYEAIALAANRDARGHGVMVVFGDGIYSGREVTKTNTVAPVSFNGRDVGQIGYMIDSTPFFYSASVKKHTVETQFYVDNLSALPRVDIAFFYVDADAEILDYMAERASGIVIAGAGAGRISNGWVNKIAQLEKKNYPVVRTARYSSGPISCSRKFDHYNNVIRGNNLTPQKARILLQLALTYTHNIEEITKLFEIY